MSVDLRSVISNPILDTYIVMIEIKHPNLHESIKLCTNNEDITAQGYKWLACQFLITLPTRNNSLRTAQLTVQNVDSRIAEAAQSINTPCTVMISIARAEDPEIFDVEYPPMKLSEISGDAMSITGELTNPFSKDEPYPKVRTTKSIAPGLYTDVLATY